MLKWLALLVISACSLLPTHARACDELGVTSNHESTCVVGVTYLGMEGTWVEKAKAFEVQRRLRIFKEYELQIDSFKYSLELAKRETASLRSAVQHLESANAHLTEQSELAAADARKAREEQAAAGRWYKSPLFWGITMFIAGAAIQNICCSGR